MSAQSKILMQASLERQQRKNLTTGAVRVGEMDIFARGHCDTTENDIKSAILGEPRDCGIEKLAGIELQKVVKKEGTQQE